LAIALLSNDAPFRYIRPFAWHTHRSGLLALAQTVVFRAGPDDRERRYFVG
jgi:hypothetical protein